MRSPRAKRSGMSTCERCGAEMSVSDMPRLLVKRGYADSPKVLIRCCDNCLADAAELLGVSVPDSNRGHFGLSM